jgi:hypothetical protein
MSIPVYPGVAVRKGDSHVSTVQRIQSALAALGIGDGLTDGVFDTAMESAVRLFQSRQVDTAGIPLKVDGIVGRFTWIALFGVSDTARAPGFPVLARLPAQMLAVATTQIGVRETPGQPNRGPQVDQYLRTTGIANPGANPPGGYPWCQAFLYWCAVQACSALGRADVPVPKTAGVLNHWQLAASVPGVRRITKAQALADPTLVTPGMFFTLDFGSGQGHTGLVERLYPDGRLVTIEGNSNATGSRDGIGVYRLERRKLTSNSADKLKGFVDFSAA